MGKGGLHAAFPSTYQVESEFGHGYVGAVPNNKGVFLKLSPDVAIYILMHAPLIVRHPQSTAVSSQSAKGKSREGAVISGTKVFHHACTSDTKVVLSVTKLIVYYTAHITFCIRMHTQGLLFFSLSYQ
jgi:hypothetical protein